MDRERLHPKDESSMSVSGFGCKKLSIRASVLILSINGPRKQSSHLIGPAIPVLEDNYFS